MVEYVKWSVLIILILRWAVFGYVASKHGQDKDPGKHNAFAHLLVTLNWCVMFYVLWFELK